MGPGAPKFDALRYDTIAAPGWRSGNVTSVEPTLHLLEPLLEGRPAVERARLVGRPGAKLRISRATGEIGVGFRIRYAFDAAFDTHLSAQRLPVEQQSSSRILGDVEALGALLMGIKDEAFWTMRLQQHHPGRRLSIRASGRHCHGFGLVGLAGPRLGKPLVEQLEGVGAHP